MSITVEQSWDEVNTTQSVNYDEDSAEVEFMAFTTDNEGEREVRAYARPVIPDLYEGLVFRKMDVARKGSSGDVWRIIAHYEPVTSSYAQPALAVNETRWSVRSNSTSSMRRAYSLGLVSESVLPALEDKYSFEGTESAKIVGLKPGAGGEFEIEGYEAAIGDVQISVETVKTHSEVSAGYLLNATTWANQQAVNIDTWKYFDPGTLRLLDFSAVQRAGAQADWDIGIVLSFSPNLSNLSVGELPKIAAKKGHQLLDVLYGKRKVGSVVTSVPVRAAVHDWYPGISFSSVLGI